MTEGRLRRIVAEATMRVIRESVSAEHDEYDWSGFYDDPEWVKEIENQASWDYKNGKEKHAFNKSCPDTFKERHLATTHDEDWALGRGDIGGGFDDSYTTQFDDRDVSDEYFTDSDFMFSHDEWPTTGGDKWYSYRDEDDVDYLQNPDSLVNRRLIQKQRRR